MKSKRPGNLRGSARVLYVYVSNESNQLVYFDDVKIDHNAEQFYRTVTILHLDYR